MRHDLKILSPFYEAVIAETKQFELRRDDRGYSVGDQLLLREWSTVRAAYTGRWALVDVTYLLSGQAWLQPGVVAMSIKLVQKGNLWHDA